MSPKGLITPAVNPADPGLIFHLWKKQKRELQVPIQLLHICSHLHILYVHSTLKFIGIFSTSHPSLARMSGFAQEETGSERVVISCKSSAQAKADLSPRPHFRCSPVLPILSLTPLVVCH